MESVKEKRSRNPTAKGLEHMISISKGEFNSVKKNLHKLMRTQQQLGPDMHVNYSDAMDREFKAFKECLRRLTELGIERDEFHSFHNEMLQIEQQLAKSRSLDEDRLSIKSSMRGSSRKSPSIVSRTSSVSNKKVEIAADLAKLLEEDKNKNILKEARAKFADAQMKLDDAERQIEIRKSQAAIESY